MITESSIYWILKLDDIRAALSAFIVIFAVIMFLSVLFWAIASVNDSRYSATAKRFFIIALSAFVVCGTACAFTPSTKQMVMIKVIPAVANNKFVGEMSADAKEIHRLLIKAIKEALGENKE